MSGIDTTDNDFEIEIFSAGKWNNDSYTEKDIDDIVDSFNEIGKDLKPYLKLGHSENQELLQKDGYPAAGWVTGLRRNGEKLLAKLSKVPSKIKELIEKKAYGRVSSEIFWNLKHNDKLYPRALKAVALLGADTPAVTNLDDMINLYEFDGDLKTYHDLLEENMDEEIKVYKHTIDGLETEIKEYKNTIEEQNKEIKLYKDENESLKETIKLNEKEKKDAEIKAVVDAGVKAGKVLPAQVEMYTKLGESDLESVKTIIESNEKMVDFSEETSGDQPDQKTYSKEDTETDDEKLDKQIREYMKDNDVDYKAAYLVVTGGE